MRVESLGSLWDACWSRRQQKTFSVCGHLEPSSAVTTKTGHVRGTMRLRSASHVVIKAVQTRFEKKKRTISSRGDWVRGWICLDALEDKTSAFEDTTSTFSGLNERRSSNVEEEIPQRRFDAFMTDVACSADNASSGRTVDGEIGEGAEGS